MGSTELVRLRDLLTVKNLYLPCPRAHFCKHGGGERSGCDDQTAKGCGIFLYAELLLAEVKKKISQCLREKGVFLYAEEKWYSELICRKERIIAREEFTRAEDEAFWPFYKSLKNNNSEVGHHNLSL